MDRNGNKIVGKDENFVIDKDSASITLAFISTTYGWGVF